MNAQDGKEDETKREITINGEEKRASIAVDQDISQEIVERQNVKVEIVTRAESRGTWHTLARITNNRITITTVTITIIMATAIMSTTLEPDQLTMHQRGRQTVATEVHGEEKLEDGTELRKVHKVHMKEIGDEICNSWKTKWEYAM